MSNSLKMYCYLSNETSNELLECAIVSIQATPNTLREMAKFLLESANSFEKNYEDDGLHFHLQDEWKDWNSEFPDLVVHAASKI